MFPYAETHIGKDQKNNQTTIKDSYIKLQPTKDSYIHMLVWTHHTFFLDAVIDTLKDANQNFYKYLCFFTFDILLLSNNQNKDVCLIVCG